MNDTLGNDALSGVKVVLLGATGSVGGYYKTKALSAGHSITAIVRNAAKLADEPNLTIMEGDVSDPKTLSAAMEGADVVVSCLGNVKGVRIMEKSATAVLDAAAGQPNPPKCLFVSSIGCGDSSWLIGQILALIGGRASFNDYHAAHDRIAAETKVPFVLVRPSALKESPGNGKYRTFTTNGTFARPMAKEDVAQFLLDATTSSEWDGGKGINLAGVK